MTLDSRRQGVERRGVDTKLNTNELRVKEAGQDSRRRDKVFGDVLACTMTNILLKTTTKIGLII